MAKIRELLIAILVFSAVITSVSVYMADLSGNFGVQTDDISTLSQAEVVANKTVEFNEAFKSKVTGNEIIDGIIGTVSGFIQFIDLVSTSLFGFWDGLINGVSEYFFIPGWLIAIILAIVVIYILFDVISSIIKQRV